ncbi:TetR/AcrR family transcriptional regulator [Rhizobium sp. NLR22b]|uniref:TetR/AcrR family transcriptional regulator n=1 Tax=Rhizobium sp. NLR22b TaxID=2731115 RepID=UPI001C82A152|nr:TetR/AcrR family transcriptional regulator [Rhizobium sp. NLR22b]MBX5239412.1 TetR/AcrR family transcriptional regulator [Rhizobium sp. NLR22b]
MMERSSTGRSRTEPSAGFCDEDPSEIPCPATYRPDRASLRDDRIRSRTPKGLANGKSPDPSIESRAEERSHIVEAATTACRRYGPLKTNVTDIARLIGKSPASVYKVFPTKAAVLDAVAARFFEQRFCFTQSAESGQASAGAFERNDLEQHRLVLQARTMTLRSNAHEPSWCS